MELPPLKPQLPKGTTGPLSAGGHGTARAGSRTGPMHPHALVVSLHDVSPRTQTACNAILNDLEALGVMRCSLLVIPNHHGEGHFLEDSAFCEWLQARAEAGHEVVIHGYYHRRARPEHEDLLTRLTTRVYTAEEGEFYDIDRATAATLLSQARTDFSKLGLAPDGFIAPAWLMNAETQAVLKEGGCEYTTTLKGITDLRTGRVYKSQSLVWSVRSAWRRATSRVWNEALFRATRTSQLLRLAIHPVDLQYHDIWMQIRRILVEALRDRATFTYDRWVTRERTFRVLSR